MKLVVVESPTKSKTISRFLGKEYTVESSYGHIRDLPSYNIGVDVENNFEPHYVVSRKVRPTVKKLKQLAQKADTLILATDEDREGEAIAWHLLYALGMRGKKSAKAPNPKVERIVFHEITKDAINHALQNPRDIDQNLVDAQQARRILDRLVGYKLSPFLWKKLTRGLSAGRVQSVALRLVVDREKEIRAHTPQKFWIITAKFHKEGCTNKEDTACLPFEATLYAINGEKIEKPGIMDKKTVDTVLDSADKNNVSLTSVKKKQRKKQPSPPFTTATLQQNAWGRLRFSAKKTMVIAQQLYEGIDVGGKGSTGLITYMRTDSVNIASQAISAVRSYIQNTFSEKYLPQKERRFRQKSKDAQEAHEAIRPVDVTLTPDAIKQDLTKDQYRLYSLIWSRFVASQMAEALFEQTTIEIEMPSRAGKDAYQFRAQGNILTFDGFLSVWKSKTEDVLLPNIIDTDVIVTMALEDDERETQPPSRYTEASLIKALEKFGIGRPSTYAPIMSTIQERGYVIKNESKQLVPSEMGEKVNDLLVEHFPRIVDIDFTAQMEQELDEIATGNKEWRTVIRDFYSPFAKNLEEKYETVEKRDMTEPTGETCPECGEELVIRHGRYGKFISCSGFPECKFTKQLPPKKTGVSCPECKEGEIVERWTRRRRMFYGCSRYPDCTFALWQKPTGKKCPECGQMLVETKKAIKCSNKECAYKEEKQDA